MNKIDERDIESVLDFWFVETTPTQKYSKDAEFDLLIKNKFESLYWKVFSGDMKSWRSTSGGRLAEIIILDQFARNIFRDDRQCFAGDELALSLAHEALDAGVDIELPQDQRQFFYMPFMHSESKEVHVESLKIFKERASENSLKYEVKHKAIIDRFGRYPHRNEIMGRESTRDEIEFLKENTGF